MAENLYLLKNSGKREIQAGQYRGKNRFMVCFDEDKSVTVAAASMADAIWAAGKHWGIDPRKADFHQNCRVVRC